MIPLYDEDAPAIEPPYVTLTIILIIIVITIAISFSGYYEEIILKYGIIPKIFLNGGGFLTIITSMFLHSGIGHVLGNSYALWLFGDNVEYNLGKLRFIFFYLLVGIIATLCFVLTAPSAIRDIPLIGASGAISGLMGGYLVLFPRNKIRVMFSIGFRPIFFNVSAYVYIIIWFLYQLLYQDIYRFGSSVAFMGHIGGFISGILLIFIFKRNISRVDYIERSDNSL